MPEQSAGTGQTAVDSPHHLYGLPSKLPTEADTLSGLVFSELGRAPKVGDKITVNETMIQIEAMKDLGVAEVSLQLPEGEVDPLEWEVADHD